MPSIQDRVAALANLGVLGMPYGYTKDNPFKNATIATEKAHARYALWLRDQRTKFSMSESLSEAELHEIIGLIKKKLAQSAARRDTRRKQASWERHVNRMTKGGTDHGVRKSETMVARERHKMQSRAGERGRY